MRLLGRLEVRSGWNYLANHVAGVDKILEDEVSRWNPETLASETFD